MAVAPPTALTNVDVAHPEHSLIGMVGFCARTALMNVIVSGPGISPRTMICGLAFSRLRTCGVSSVAPGLVICEATTLYPFWLARLCMYCVLPRPPGAL